MTDLSHLAQPGTLIEVRVTPRASRNAVLLDDGAIRVTVTTVPEDGKANAALVELIAKALRLPRSDVTLVSGQTSRLKTLEIAGHAAGLAEALARAADRG